MAEMRWIFRSKKAQSVMEYALLLAIVSGVFMAMSMYVKRAVQGTIYRMEDQATSKANRSSQFL